MPFLIKDARRGGRQLAAAISLALLAAAPASAAELSNPTNCTPEGTVQPVFTAWNDFALYTQAPAGSMETGATGWMLSGGAGVVAGNQPWKFADADQSSLKLPPGSSAISAPMCVDRTYPYFRLFARNLTGRSATLKVDVLYLDAKGNVMATKAFNHSTSSGSWQPTGMIKIGLFTDKTTVDAAPISFRFTPDPKMAGGWQIDDLYVDPWARR